MIQTVPIREAFAHEAHDFTTWLAENIATLSDQIGLPLRVEAREQRVGSFRVDLVCQDAQGNLVVIENQLERTNHDHHGKIQTYMAGVRAHTGIWITPDPRPEHIESMRYLNEQTRDGYDFYLVKVEAIRIDDSRPAPLFTVIVAPDALDAPAVTRELTRVSVEIAEEPLDDTPDQPVGDSPKLPPVWGVYPRRDEETYRLFLDHGVIGIGFGNLGDMRKIPPDAQAVREEWQRINSEQTAGEVKTYASIMHSFGHLAKPGDLVIYPPTWKERVIYVGRITGEYDYDRYQPDGYDGLRPVEWFARLEREQFSPTALRKIQVPLAFFRVRQEDFLGELAALLGDHLN
jgi:hypothetical protein